MDWHNKFYEGEQRRAIYRGQAAMDCPLCGQPVLWFESSELAVPAAEVQLPVFRRLASIAAQWVPIREAAFVNLAGYVANHTAGQQYNAYWQPGEVQQADQQVDMP